MKHLLLMKVKLVEYNSFGKLFLKQKDFVAKRRKKKVNSIQDINIFVYLLKVEKERFVFINYILVDI